MAANRVKLARLAVTGPGLHAAYHGMKRGLGARSVIGP